MPYDKLSKYIGGSAVVLFALAAPSLAQTGRYQVVYPFCSKGGCSDGSSPRAGLSFDTAGNLYGTTWEGGNVCYGGCGVVFKLSPDGSETVLHDFGGVNDGSFPVTGVIIDKRGNLFGTTTYGSYGVNGGDCGTVFEINVQGNESILHGFTAGSDGCSDPSALIEDKDGNLFGETPDGGGSDCYGNGCGTIFEIAPDGTESIVYSFASGAEGPIGGLVRDKDGNFYGTTGRGGGSGCYYGCGTVFELTPGNTLTVLHAFSNASGDGTEPMAGVIRDDQGNLYGTTKYGGARNKGTVFKVASDGTESVLYSFRGAAKNDGSFPVAGLIEDKAGNLYGTTEAGGNGSPHCQEGCGTVFKLAPSGSETVLHGFLSSGHGHVPRSSLILDGKGLLYGTTSEGQHGSVFVLNK